MPLLPPDGPEPGPAGDELEVDLAAFLPEGVAIGEETPGYQAVDLAVLAGIEADLAAVDAALEAIDADDLRRSALLVGLLDLDRDPGSTGPGAD